MRLEEALGMVTEIRASQQVSLGEALQDVGRFVVRHVGPDLLRFRRKEPRPFLWVVVAFKERWHFDGRTTQGACQY